MVYTGVVLYDLRKDENYGNLKAIDPLPPVLVAYNQSYGNIDADLADYESDESLLKKGTRVRFTYSYQGPHTYYSLIGFLYS